MDKETLAAHVRTAQMGDTGAFTELVRAMQDIAVAYATSLLHDYHLAQDAAQEAFVEAYLELPRLREPLAFSAWLRTVVYKHCDRITRRKQHKAIGLDAAREIASPALTPQELLERNEVQAQVQQAIATLPEVQRQVVLLYYMGEHSSAAIAEFLEVTPNTVKTRLYAARKKLKTIMETLDEDLGAARPSGSATFTQAVQRMIQPEELKRREPLKWSAGMGTDVWELFCACITGDLATVEQLIAKDPSLVRSHYVYRTPLYFAVRENQLEVARFLLDQGADPLGLAVNDSLLQITRDRGYTQLEKLLEEKYAALHGASPKGETLALAIRERDLARVKGLLDASPGLIHEGDGTSNQPIHWAVMTRQLDMIDELLARGADINAPRQDGARPIQLTNGDYMFRGWRDVPKDWPTTPELVLDHLREHGAYVDICTAASIGDLERVRELLDNDPSLANRVSEYVTYYLGSGAPLKNAAAKGHIEIVKLLLERGADPNLPEEGIAPQGHALHSAVVNGHIDIVRLLLKHGAYPNVEIESSADTLSAALGSAGYRTPGNQEMVELLCSHGAARPVHLLAYSNDLQTAAAVFAANPELANDPGSLANAAGQGHEGFVRLMLRYHPALPKSVTFPAWSVGAKTRELNELLFEHGMNPSQPDWLGITALHQFARKGEVEKARVFIEHGADVNARDTDICSTPLGWAAKYGQVELAKLLLEHGARPSLPDDPSWATPLAWATRRGHAEIIALLT
ncbi:MAG: sigma-70 family RNA polymerase sigma factor [Armatimonas sp.]